MSAFHHYSGERPGRWHASPSSWLAAFACTLVVWGVLMAGSAQAEAGHATIAGSSAGPEVLTLQEAASLLRVSPKDVEQLARQQRVPGRRIGTQWRFSRTALVAWLAGEEPVSAVRNPSLPDARHETPADPATAPLDSPGVQPTPGSRQGVHVSEAELPRLVGRGTSTPSASTPPPAADKDPETIGEKPELGTAQDIFLRTQRVLLKARQATVELGLFYSKTEQQDIRLLPSDSLPLPVLAQVEQNTFTSSYTVRYGLLDDLQLFASAPLRHQTTTITVGSIAGVGGQKTRETRTEWGDISVGLRRAVVKEGLGYPDVLLSVEGQIPTVQSSFGIGGGVALVKSIDPAVLFANLHYRHTFSREFTDITRLQPEDTLSVLLGYAFALNDTLTLSTAVSGLFTRRTTFSNAVLPSRERFSLQLGLTSQLRKDLYIEPTISYELTGTGSNITLGVSLPYTFGF